MKRILLVLVLAAVSVQAKTLAEVKTAADAILDPYWTDTVVPAQETFFDANGIYGQCLESFNPPNTTTADGTVQEAVGDAVDTAPSNGTGGQTCADIIGATLQTNKPWVLRIDVSEGQLGHEFIACVYASHNGTEYERCKAHTRAGTGPGGNFTGVPWRVRP